MLVALHPDVRAAIQALPNAARNWIRSATESVFYAPSPRDPDYLAPGEKTPSGRTRFARRDELDAVARMLTRHHGIEPGRARAMVWCRPGVVEGLFARGRPPKAYLIHDAEWADEVLSQGREVRWDAVHRASVALNEPEEMRTVEYRGERFTEPRDSEQWQRAVRRIRTRLRAAAAALAEAGPSESRR